MKFRYLATAVAIAAFVSTKADATLVSANVAFTKVNQNPWKEGDAYANAWSYDDLQTNLRVNVPSVGASASGILADFLGLPSIGFANIGGSFDGNAGLSLGYAVNGGRMNITYPGRGTVDFATLPGTDKVTAGFNVPTQTSFDPGLLRLFAPVGGAAELAGIAGGGYAPGESIPGIPIDRFFEPTFQTSFPNAAAWATFGYDIDAGLFAEAGVAKVLGECVLCVRRNVDLDSAETIELVNVNKNGVEVIGAGRADLFGQDIAFGTGSLRVDYPDVAVKGVLQADGRTVAGDNAKPILSLNASFEKLLPFVGALLRQSIGPFDVTLLSVDGGPILSLYQDFKLDVMPKVTLKFDTVVEWVKDDGSYFVNEIDAMLGDTVDWRPLLGSRADIKVQTIFRPEGTITNETGFALGYNLDINALSVDTGFGDLGPIDVATLTEDAAIRLPPFYTNTFGINLPQIALNPKTLNVVSPILDTLDDVSFSVSGVQDLGNRQYKLTVINVATGFSYTLDAAGRTELIGSTLGGDGAQEIFIADENVRLSTQESEIALINLGRGFCIACENGALAFAAVSPSFFDAGEQLFIPDLTNYRRDIVDFENDPNLNRSTFRTILANSQEIGPIVPVDDIVPVGVPEPLTLALFGLGLAVLGATRGCKMVTHTFQCKHIDVSRWSGCGRTA